MEQVLVRATSPALLLLIPSFLLLLNSVEMWQGRRKGEDEQQQHLSPVLRGHERAVASATGHADQLVNANSASETLAGFHSDHAMSLELHEHA